MEGKMTTYFFNFKSARGAKWRKYGIIIIIIVSIFINIECDNPNSTIQLQQGPKSTT